MNSEWESMAIDDMLALRELMQEVLSEKLIARKAALERRLQSLNQQPRVVKTVKPGRRTLLVAFGHCGFAWQLLPLVSNL